MLSPDTNETLALLLLSMSECERQVELSREELCLNPNFDPYSVFKQLEIENNGKISRNDLKNFLFKRSMAITPLFLDLLIAQYDSNQDSCLSLEEFKAFILPNKNPDLAYSALNRKTLPSLYVDSLLARHIELESNWQGRIQSEKRSLFLKPDFSAPNIFRVLSAGSEHFITPQSLKQFFLSIESEISDEECERIIMRIDTDNDSQLSYQEFLDFILPVNQKLPNIVKFCTKPVNRSRTKDLSRPRTENSPVKIREVEASPKMKNFVGENCNDQIKDIVKVFKKQVEIDVKCEKFRAKLASHLDFSFDELIKLIDKQRKKFVVKEDFERVLRDLHVPFHEDEVLLIFLQFGKNDKIGYRQVKELFVPMLWKEHKRVCFIQDEGYRVFSADTLNDLVLLLKSLLQSNADLEAIRRSIVPELKSQFFQNFHEIDQDKSNSISLSDFRSYLGHSMNLREQQVRLLFRRYSKSFHKEITYSDFLEELTPKLR